jgi:hypothetical protein
MGGRTCKTSLNDAALDWLREVHKGDRKLIKTNQALMAAEDPVEANYLYHRRHKDGHWIRIMSRGRIVTRDMLGMLHEIIRIDSDVTGIKNNEGQKGCFMKEKQFS